MSDFFNILRPKARHRHRCDYCGGPIFKDERYVVGSGIFEGDWQSWKMHDECYEEQANSDDAYFDPFEATPPERVKHLIELEKKGIDPGIGLPFGRTI